MAYVTVGSGEGTRKRKKKGYRGKMKGYARKKGSSTYKSIISKISGGGGMRKSAGRVKRRNRASTSYTTADMTLAKSRKKFNPKRKGGGPKKRGPKMNKLYGTSPRYRAMVAKIKHRKEQDAYRK